MRASIDREEILDEALRVFGRLGFRKASISDIVRPLGVGKTAIYHHFPGGKNEIIDMCLAREEQAILDEMHAAVNGCEDPREQLRAMIVAKYEHVQGLRSVMEVTGEVGYEINRLYQEHERSFISEEESRIADILERGQEMGIFRSGSPQRLAGCLRALFARYDFDIAFGVNDKFIQDQFDMVLDLIFHGLVVAEQCEGDLS